MDEQQNNLPAVNVSHDLTPQVKLYTPVTEILERLDMVRELRQKAMKSDVHFGIIPGTNDKPALWQAGADMLRMMFNLQPAYNIMRDEEILEPHRGYVIHTTLTNAVSGAVWGQGVGSCSTMEAKYRWRNAKRTCPECGADAIGKGRAEYGGGFFCGKKQGGCGANFKANDKRITEQQVGRMENADIADQYNTVLKMAKKRSFVDAILNATGAREMFSSVIEEPETEDMPEFSPDPPQQPLPLPSSQNSKKRDSKPLLMAIGKQQLKDTEVIGYIKQRFELEFTGALSALIATLGDDEFKIILSEIEDGTVKSFTQERGA